MQTTLPARPLFGYRAISELTDLKIGTLRSAVSEGRLKLRFVRIGNQRVFDADEVERWKQAGLRLDGKTDSPC